MASEAHILVVVGLIALSALVVVVPLLLPWPQRLRWTIASNGDVWAASGWAATGYVLSEARVDAVVAERFLVCRAGAGPGWWMTVDAGSDDDRQIGRRELLEDWCARSTPLLFVETAGSASLYGAERCVTGLVVCRDAVTA